MPKELDLSEAPSYFAVKLRDGRVIKADALELGAEMITAGVSIDQKDPDAVKKMAAAMKTVAEPKDIVNALDDRTLFTAAVHVSMEFAKLGKELGLPAT